MAPPEIGIVMISTRDDLVSKFRAAIAKSFRTNFASGSSPQELRQKIYATHPDILILDENAISRLVREGHLDRNTNQDILEDRFVITVGEPAETLPVESDRHANLGRHPSDETIVETVENAAETLGYMTDEGKVDQRLVQRPLDVIVKSNGQDMSGYTTGINLNGCGVQLLNLDVDLSEGDSCRVQIDEPDFQGFIPAGGEILEVAESYEDDVDVFLRIRFTGEGFPSNDLARDVFEDLISRQEDDSVSWS